MEEDERRVARVIGSEARDALRGQRSHLLHEHRVSSSSRRRRESKSVRESQMHSELLSHIVSYRRPSNEREVQQERITQN